MRRLAPQSPSLGSMAVFHAIEVPRWATSPSLIWLHFAMIHEDLASHRGDSRLEPSMCARAHYSCLSCATSRAPQCGLRGTDHGSTRLQMLHCVTTTYHLILRFSYYSVPNNPLAS